jgi:hypothetical protein
MEYVPLSLATAPNLTDDAAYGMEKKLAIPSFTNPASHSAWITARSPCHMRSMPAAQKAFRQPTWPA